MPITAVLEKPVRVDFKQASKHIYLSMTGYQKSHWLNNVTAQTVNISSHKEQKTYILATPHRHNITVINVVSSL